MSRPTTQSAPATGATTPGSWVYETTNLAASKRGAILRRLGIDEKLGETPASFRAALGPKWEEKIKQADSFTPGKVAEKSSGSWLDDLGRRGRKWSKDKPVLGALDSWMFGNEVE